MLWDMSKQKQLCKLYGGNDAINTVVFSPNRYWMCAAVGPAIKVWDLKCKTVLDELILDKMYTPNMKWLPHCTSLAWSSDGKNLFAGMLSLQLKLKCVYYLLLGYTDNSNLFFCN